MKKFYSSIWTLMLILIFGCNDQNTDEISLDKYFSLNYVSYERNGEMVNFVRPVIHEQNDSIGVIKKEIARDSFDYYIRRIVFPNIYEKQEFTYDEMMKIASRFFLVEKRGDRGLGARICSTANGLPERQEIDYTLLESFVFDAIFSKIQQENLSKVNFLNNANSYLKESISDNMEIKSLDSLEIMARSFVFTSMEKDGDLIQNLLTYYESNKNNIPIIVRDKL